jgi:hypothetical protein
MTLERASHIVKSYSSVLGMGFQDGGRARKFSWLPASPKDILTAFKLTLALEIANGTLTQELSGLMLTCARSISYFIPDDLADRVTFVRLTEEKSLSLLPENVEDATPAEWATYNEIEAKIPPGWKIESNELDLKLVNESIEIMSELIEFIALVQKIDRSDHLYGQRVYTLANTEFISSEKRWFDMALRSAKK